MENNFRISCVFQYEIQFSRHLERPSVGAFEKNDETDNYRSKLV